MNDRYQIGSSLAAVPVGIVICCHGSMGSGIREAAEMIVGAIEQLAVVGVFPGDSRKTVIDALGRAVEEVDRGSGVIVLADMPGGTPFNLLAAEFMPLGVEVVAGFNLPALLKALVGRRTECDAGRLAGEVIECGRRHMIEGRETVGPCCDAPGEYR